MTPLWASPAGNSLLGSMRYAGFLSKTQKPGNSKEAPPAQIFRPARSISADDFTSGENNFCVVRAFAPALQNERLARPQQRDLLVLRGFPDQRLSSLSRINAFVIGRIIKDRDHANKPVGGLEQDIVFPNKQSGFEPFNHASDAEGFPAVALVGGGRISFALLHQFGRIHALVRLQWRQAGDGSGTLFHGVTPLAGVPGRFGRRRLLGG